MLHALFCLPKDIAYKLGNKKYVLQGCNAKRKGQQYKLFSKGYNFLLGVRPMMMREKFDIRQLAYTEDPPPHSQRSTGCILPQALDYEI